MSTRKEERLTRTFEATDTRGHRHEIEIWRRYTISRVFGGDPRIERLPDNERVQLNYLEKGKSRVVATGEILSSDNPAAD